MKENGLGTGARERLLEAAGEIFAEQGFRSATVREICGRAGVNVAAINYHFGDKEGLYFAALKHWQAAALQKYPPDLGVDRSASPEERLRAYIRSFVFRMLEQGRPSWYGKLWAREFIEPTGALDILVEETIRPSFTLLSSIILELLGPEASKKTVSLCTTSILGQCLYFRNSSPVISRLLKRESFTSAEIQEIADHIARFSLKALKSYYPMDGESKAATKGVKDR